MSEPLKEPEATEKPAAKKDLAAKDAAKSAEVMKLHVDDLSVTYRTSGGEDVEAVRDVSFSIKDKPGIGEIIVFLGPSGCGKSTILKCVAGLLSPSKGGVHVDGEKVIGVSKERGMVFQTYTSFDWLTVKENVAYGPKLHGVDKKTAEAEAMKYIEAVGLADAADLYPKQLSGGMKQRVAIARTLINKPKLLLMDEPFGALDPHTRWEMQGLLIDMSHKEDNTILFITHDVTEAVYIADSIFVLSSRPARIRHRVEVPTFARRDHGLKTSPEFRAVEEKVLEMLYNEEGRAPRGAPKK